MQIGVIGAGACSAHAAILAYEVGRLIAQNNFVLVCGGLGGIMEHAARGAYEAGGLTVGILPGFELKDANPFIRIAIPTGLSHARNILVVRASLSVIAIEGSYGTLSEIAIALKLGKPVIGLDTWDVGPDIIKAATPEDAVTTAIRMMKKVRS
ncbi:MAG: TIGR00725 family protein [Pseudomonadota bacterium]